MVFTKTDYESNNGMSTSVFGPPIWFSLHMMSFNYPVNPTDIDKANYREYLLALGKVLPCSHCRNNFSNNLKSAGFNKGVFKDRDTFSKFVYKLHNVVNDRLGSKTKISYNDVRDRFEHFRSRCPDKNIKKRL